MSGFPYTAKPATLTKFLTHIQQAGIPPKVTTKYLKEAGFTSSNDPAVIGVLKFLGFIDGSGGPTEKWTKFRDTQQAPLVMAKALREAYSSLFTAYPDAYKKDDEALRNYFRANTKVSDHTVALMVTTFKILCTQANFDAVTVTQLQTEQVQPTPVQQTPGAMPPTAPDITINVNIQLQLPATDDAAVYDKLFAALRKHLFS